MGHGQNRIMGLFSLFRSNKKLEPPPAEAAPPVTPAAMPRALRATAVTKGSYNAAELGERIATALSTIETAVLAVDAITERLREAADLAADAASGDDLGRRALLAGRYDELREEIDGIARSATHNRVNLIAGRRVAGKPASFDIAFDDEERSGVAIQIVNLTSGEGGLALSPPREAFADDGEIAAISAEIAAARQISARASDRFADHAALISERLSRLMEMAGPREIGTLVPTGADPQDEAHPASGPAMAEVEDKLRALSERLGEKTHGEKG